MTKRYQDPNEQRDMTLENRIAMGSSLTFRMPHQHWQKVATTTTTRSSIDPNQLCQKILHVIQEYRSQPVSVTHRKHKPPMNVVEVDTPCSVIDWFGMIGGVLAAWLLDIVPATKWIRVRALLGIDVNYASKRNCLPCRLPLCTAGAPS